MTNYIFNSNSIVFKLGYLLKNVFSTYSKENYAFIPTENIYLDKNISTECNLVVEKCVCGDMQRFSDYYSCPNGSNFNS